MYLQSLDSKGKKKKRSSIPECETLRHFRPTIKWSGKNKLSIEKRVQHQFVVQHSFFPLSGENYAVSLPKSSMSSLQIKIHLGARHPVPRGDEFNQRHRRFHAENTQKLTQNHLIHSFKCTNVGNSLRGYTGRFQIQYFISVFPPYIDGRQPVWEPLTSFTSGRMEPILNNINILIPLLQHSETSDDS